MKKEIEKFENHKSMILKLMSYRMEMEKTFFSRRHMVRSSINAMLFDIDNLIKDDKYKTTSKKVGEIHHCLSIFVDMLVFSDMTPFLKDFIAEYLLLANNWNKQLGKSSAVDAKIVTTKKLIDQIYGLNDLIEIQKLLVRKLEKYKYFEPESFKLSRHYLKLLEGRLEEGKE